MIKHDNIPRPIAIQVGRKVLFIKIHDIVDRIVVILSCVAVGILGFMWVSYKSYIERVSEYAKI